MTDAGPTDGPTDGDGLFDGLDGEDIDSSGEGEEQVVHAHAPRKLIATFGVALAAFVFIGVAGGALLLFLILRIRDHADPNHTVRDKYTNSYTRCVQAGGTKLACGAQVLQACEKDSWWNNAARVGQRETVCLATVPDLASN